MQCSLSAKVWEEIKVETIAKSWKSLWQENDEVEVPVQPTECEMDTFLNQMGRDNAERANWLEAEIIDNIKQGYQL